VIVPWVHLCGLAALPCESRAVTIASGDELLVTSIDLIDA
jgi:hypothetical protein